MRSLKTRPKLGKRFGPAFHAELLPPFLNIILREDETRGASALESASSSELPILCSPLNQEERLGNYRLRAINHIESYRRAQEGKQKAKNVGKTATADDITDESSFITDDTTHTEEDGTDESWFITDDTMIPDAQHMYTKPLPEHYVLRGLPFAREADAPSNNPLTDDTEGAVGEQAEANLSTDFKTEGEAQAAEPTEDARQAGEQTKEGEAEEAQQKHEKKTREAEEIQLAKVDEETEVQRQEGQPYDPALFPAAYFERSEYSFNERMVRQDCVQDAETCESRYIQLLWLAANPGNDFEFQTDENERYRVSVPGAPFMEPDPKMKMPEVHEGEDGARFVYVTHVEKEVVE
ncbi:hypothetical protein F5Y19DRAFT_479348 [Xylariaceae sp. FL1651]|nr:hypothetical protein F5Y19DRAFT_479348 [Xylariaceae sp. FL1651]